MSAVLHSSPAQLIFNTQSLSAGNLGSHSVRSHCGLVLLDMSQ